MFNTLNTNTRTERLSSNISYAHGKWFVSERSGTRCSAAMEPSPKRGLIAAMNLPKIFIRSISHMFPRPGSREWADL